MKEERMRLGLSQAQLAAHVGATRHSVINWESEAAQPPAVAVGAMGGCGMDVLYILTGQRSQAVSEVDLLSPQDRILLDNFHHAPAAVQAGIKTALGAFAPAPAIRPRKTG